MRSVWYPGHMARARAKIFEVLPMVDLVVEVRDARAPLSSRSPESDLILSRKPVGVVLSKADLAEGETTGRWLEVLAREGFEFCAALDLRDASCRKELSRLVRKGARPEVRRERRVMVVGIPNVGKSTLINALAGRRRASVAPVPGHTRGLQFYRGEGFLLLDTPGVLEPGDGAELQRRLAWIGCVRADVIGGYYKLAVELLSFLRGRGLMDRVLSRYGLVEAEGDAMEVLSRIGRSRGLLLKGGEVNLEEAAKDLLMEFSSGGLGRVSLEEPL